MEFKGTKGKWYVYENSYFLEVKTDIEEIGTIANCIFNEQDFNQAVNTLEECNANAKLIAAAPDLLKALQVILKHKNAINHYIDDNELYTAIEESEQAINKALN